MFYWPADKIVAYYLKNPKLCDVISYMNPMFGGVAGHTPGYISALIYVLYINGPSRFVGGSQQLAEALAEVITSYGGKVKAGCEVVGMDIEDRLVKSLSVREDKGDIFGIITEFIPVMQEHKYAGMVSTLGPKVKLFICERIS